VLALRLRSPAAREYVSVWAHTRANLEYWGKHRAYKIQAVLRTRLDVRCTYALCTQVVQTREYTSTPGPGLTAPEVKFLFPSTGFMSSAVHTDGTKGACTDCGPRQVWSGKSKVFLSPSVVYVPRQRFENASCERWRRDAVALLSDAAGASELAGDVCSLLSEDDRHAAQYLCAQSPRPGATRTYAGAPAGDASPRGKSARSPESSSTLFPLPALTSSQCSSISNDVATCSQETSARTTAYWPARVYQSQRVSPGAVEATPMADACEPLTQATKKRRRLGCGSFSCAAAPVGLSSTPVSIEAASKLGFNAGAGHGLQRASSALQWRFQPLDALRRRETGILPEHALHRQTLLCRFRGLRLRETYDANDSNRSFSLPLLQRRAGVVEIVAFGDLLFTLTANGVCTAFQTVTRKRLCCLNLSPDEVVRSIFLNKANRALITVSVRHEDRFLRLRCRSIPMDAIARGQPEDSIPIFTSECLSWPGFVEFDDVNGKVLTFSANDRSYTVWDLTTYQSLYRIACRSIAEIKVSPGVMLLIYQRVGSHVPLQFVDIETGAVRHELFYLLNRSRKIEFIELFHDRLLVKQEGVNLRIVDLRTSTEQELLGSQHLTPHHFIFLYETKLFLVFRDQEIQVWDFRARPVVQRLSRQHPSRAISAAANNTLYISAAQDILVSYQAASDANEHPRDDDPDASDADPNTAVTPQSSSTSTSMDGAPVLGPTPDASATAPGDSSASGVRPQVRPALPSLAKGTPTLQAPSSTSDHQFASVPGTSSSERLRAGQLQRPLSEIYDVHSGSLWIAHIPTGLCLGRIRAHRDSFEERRALSDVTAVYYHEDRNEIYIGGRSGSVHRWAA